MKTFLFHHFFRKGRIEKSRYRVSDPGQVRYPGQVSWSGQVNDL